ncbi:MAG TPA: hypothetical protein VNE22_04495 [Acidimicrobiales bacterium]|nr:hypothetical protein [Acidimicrobiales bacterium]
MSDANEPSNKTQDLKNRLRQFAQPLVDTLDGKLRDQVDKRVDERVEEAMAARLAVLERAIADLDRTVHELERRINELSK